LALRSTIDTTLIGTLAKLNGDATIPLLSKLTGSSESCVCTRLSKLAERGLTCSPKCQDRVRWELSEAGRKVAAKRLPMLDDLDRSILNALTRSAMRQLALARRVGVCSLTIKRRLQILIEKNMVEAEPGPLNRNRYSITDQGRSSLGESAPTPWVKVEAVSAASARDVRARLANHRPSVLDRMEDQMVAAE
jgi:DNA-binding MarR family transcriptional regulator